jgi:hypothetical protein
LINLTETLDVKAGGRVTIVVSYPGERPKKYIYKSFNGLQQLDLILLGAGTFTNPIATIAYRSHPSAFTQKETLTLQGRGEDSDKTRGIAKYEWYVNGARTSTTKKLRLAKKPTGTYIIEFRVQDGEGNWSNPMVLEYEVIP